MDNETLQLRQRARWYQEERCARNRYDEEFRAEVVELVRRRQKQGDSQRSVAEELEIPVGTVRRWLRAAEEPSGGDLLPVRVVQPTAPPSELSVVTPSGLRLEGLDLDGAIEVLGRLG